MSLVLDHNLSDYICVDMLDLFNPMKMIFVFVSTLFMMCSRVLTIHLFNTGMSELVKERPANPVQWLASYLLRHDPQKSN